jgi:hypothetical protein
VAETKWSRQNQTGSEEEGAHEYSLEGHGVSGIAKRIPANGSNAVEVCGDDVYRRKDGYAE